MIIKNVKIILLSSLIAAIILSFRGMTPTEAKNDILTQKHIDDRFAQVNDVYDDDNLNQLKELISKLGVTEVSKTKYNGDTVTEKTIVSKHGNDAYKVTSMSKAVTNGGETHTFKVIYFVNENENGSLHVHVPDARPSEKSNMDGSNGLEFILKSKSESLLPVADATSGTKKFTMEVNRTIHNNFVDGNASFVQNCGMYATAASMYGVAEATTIESYWRSINANVGGAYWYYDWCIFPSTYRGIEFEMGGSSYSDADWNPTWGYPGWGPIGGLQFPWDDIHFRTNVYYN